METANEPISRLASLQSGVERYGRSYCRRLPRKAAAHRYALPPGGGADIVGRVLGEQLSGRLGQQVQSLYVVEFQN